MGGSGSSEESVGWQTTLTGPWVRIIGDRECKKYAPCCNVNALLLYQQRYAPSGETKEICTPLSIQNDMTLVIWLLRTPRAAAVALIDVFSCPLALFQFC